MYQSVKSIIRGIYKNTVYALYKCYVNNYLHNGVLSCGYKCYLKKKENLFRCKNSDVAFIFFSDLHWGKNNMFSPLIIEHIVSHTGIRRVFSGGDIITYSDESKRAMLQLWDDFNLTMSSLAPNYYQIIGNHDNNSYQQKNKSAIFTKDEIISKQVVGDAERFGNGYSFYVDEQARLTRFLCLDTGKQYLEDYDYKSISNVLKHTPPNWHIIVLSHIILEWIDSKYQCRAYIQRLIDLMDDYNAKNEAKVEMIIAGHVHNDFYTTTNGGIPIITVGSDAYGVACGKYKHSLMPFSEQCITIFQLDYGSRKSYGTRIGRGEDFCYLLKDWKD